MGIFYLHVLYHDHFGHIALNLSLVNMSTAVTFKSTCSSLSSLGCLLKFSSSLSTNLLLILQITESLVFEFDMQISSVRRKGSKGQYQSIILSLSTLIMGSRQVLFLSRLCGIFSDCIHKINCSSISMGRGEIWRIESFCRINL